MIHLLKLGDERQQNLKQLPRGSIQLSIFRQFHHNQQLLGYLMLPLWFLLQMPPLQLQQLLVLPLYLHYFHPLPRRLVLHCLGLGPLVCLLKLQLFLGLLHRVLPPHQLLGALHSSRCRHFLPVCIRLSQSFKCIQININLKVMGMERERVGRRGVCVCVWRRGGGGVYIAVRRSLGLRLIGFQDKY